MKFLIDANILISGYKVYYPMDIHVSYWNVIAEQIANGNFIIIDKVKNEIQDEKLVDWLKHNIDNKLYASTADCMVQYSYIQEWATKNQSFGTSDKAHFADSNVADPFLVAKALKESYSVVTYELSAKGGKKIKIPDVCSHFGVTCMTINDALRRLEITV
jgi:hypothetical protein